LLTIRIVAPSTMQMPERKNISKSPWSSPKRRSSTLGGSNQRARMKMPTSDITSRLRAPKKSSTSATPNGRMVKPG
jgi:hypothetical protein